MSIRPLIRILSKKVLPPILIGGIIFFYAWLVFSASQSTLPDARHPTLLYSNQTRHDIKQTFCKALSNARQSIFLSVYGISDPQILAVLGKKMQEPVTVTIEYDPSASGNLKKLLPPPAVIRPIKSKGLMHKKIIIIDHSLVFLGSANLTATSLRHHANLVLGLYSPWLATYLESPDSPSFSFSTEGQTAEIYLLPDPQKLGIERLFHAIDSAKNRIDVAMFTLTHPAISEALIRAKNRGVDVSIAVDYYTARGASKKTLAAMGKEGVKIYLSQGRELLHHKWAVIDENLLIMGSANWTKAAFSKNQDFLFFLSPLKEKQCDFFNKLWNIIESESTNGPISVETKNAA
ncbi:MAG: hypothetical protein JSS60_09125 [Verrucomicrobia bacterium]|nr:hypothetical protein [Verrucomicrobiota bacterium]